MGLAINEAARPLTATRSATPVAALSDPSLVRTILEFSGLVGDRTYLVGGRETALSGVVNPLRFSKALLTDLETGRTTESAVDARGAFLLASPTEVSLVAEQGLRLSFVGAEGREDIYFRAKFSGTEAALSFDQVLDRTISNR